MKAQVQTKRKSFNRRKGDVSELTSAYDEVIKKINDSILFTKQTAGIAGPSQTLSGKALYDEAVKQVSGDGSPAIWERILKAVAMEDRNMNVYDYLIIPIE